MTSSLIGEAPVVISFTLPPTRARICGGGAGGGSTSAEPRRPFGHGPAAEGGEGGGGGGEGHRVKAKAGRAEAEQAVDQHLFR